MTIEQFDERIDDLLDPDFIACIKKKCHRLAQCGAVDLEQYEYDYRLPKTVLAAVLLDMVEQYAPFKWDTKARRVYKNLQRF